VKNYTQSIPKSSEKYHEFFYKSACQYYGITKNDSPRPGEIASPTSHTFKSFMTDQAVLLASLSLSLSLSLYRFNPDNLSLSLLSFSLLIEAKGSKMVENCQAEDQGDHDLGFRIRVRQNEAETNERGRNAKPKEFGKDYSGSEESFAGN